MSSSPIEPPLVSHQLTGVVDGSVHCLRCKWSGWPDEVPDHCPPSDSRTDDRDPTSMTGHARTTTEHEAVRLLRAKVNELERQVKLHANRGDDRYWMLADIALIAALLADLIERTER